MKTVPSALEGLPVREQAAWYIAIGCARPYVSTQTGVPVPTLNRWVKDETFDARVTELRERAVRLVEPHVLANLHLALEVQRQVLAGELSAIGPRYDVADKLIYRFLDKLLTVGDPAPAYGGAAPTVAVTVNTTAAARSGRVVAPDLDSAGTATDSPSG